MSANTNYLAGVEAHYAAARRVCVETLAELVDASNALDDALLDGAGASYARERIAAAEADYAAASQTRELVRLRLLLAGGVA